MFSASQTHRCNGGRAYGKGCLFQLKRGDKKQQPAARFAKSCPLNHAHVGAGDILSSSLRPHWMFVTSSLGSLTVTCRSASNTDRSTDSQCICHFHHLVFVARQELARVRLSGPFMTFPCGLLTDSSTNSLRPCDRIQCPQFLQLPSNSVQADPLPLPFFNQTNQPTNQPTNQQPTNIQKTTTQQPTNRNQ